MSIGTPAAPRAVARSAADRAACSSAGVAGKLHRPRERGVRVRVLVGQVEEPRRKEVAPLDRLLVEGGVGSRTSAGPGRARRPSRRATRQGPPRPPTRSAARHRRG